MTVGHASMPDAQKMEDRRGQRVLVGLRQHEQAVAVAAAADQKHRSAMGTAGHRAPAPSTAPSTATATASTPRVGSV